MVKLRGCSHFFPHPLFLAPETKNVLKLGSPRVMSSLFRGNVSRSEGVQLNIRSWLASAATSQLAVQVCPIDPQLPGGFQIFDPLCPPPPKKICSATDFIFISLFCFAWLRHRVAETTLECDPQYYPVLARPNLFRRGLLTFRSQRLRTESCAPSVVPAGAWGRRSSGSRYYCQLM